MLTPKKQKVFNKIYEGKEYEKNEENILYCLECCTCCCISCCIYVYTEKERRKDFEWDGKTISYEDIPTLEKTPGKDYKILMFSDTQLTFLTQGTKSVKEVMRKTLDKTQPDFVVFSGDNVAESQLIFKLIFLLVWSKN